MKNLSRALALLAWLAAATSPVAAATVLFAPAASEVRVGDTVEVDVVVADAADLYAFQFDVAFDPARLHALDVAEGGFLGAAGGATAFVPGAIDNAAGTVSFTAGTLLGAGPGASGAGFLARLRFEARGPGRADLGFAEVVLLDSTLAELAASPLGTSLEIAPVPEPGSAALFAAGLALGWGVVRRRRDTRG